MRHIIIHGIGYDPNNKYTQLDMNLHLEVL